MYLGDFAEDATVDFMWSTNGTDGGSITRSTNGTVSVYKANGTTQTTTGVTDTEDFDSLTGIHHCRIDTSADAFYAAGSEYMVVLSAATIDTKTVNAVLAHFSIERTGGALALLKNATYGLSALETIVDDLEGRLTATRAGYLDNLSAGAVATQASVNTIDDFLDTEVSAILADTNELQTDWVNGGRLDLLIDAIKAKTDNLPADPADDSDIDTQLAAIAAYLDTEVAAILAAVDTEVAAIKTKTDYLPGATAGSAGGVFIAGSNAATTVDFTGNLSGSVGSVTGAVGSVTGAVGSVTGNVGGNVAGSVGSLAAQAKADVNAEAVDALATDTYAELGAVPAATASLKDKITWLYMLARNTRLTTASADKVRNDANSSDIGTSALSDDGTTFTRGEYA